MPVQYRFRSCEPPAAAAAKTSRSRTSHKRPSSVRSCREETHLLPSLLLDSCQDKRRWSDAVCRVDVVTAVAHPSEDRPASRPWAKASPRFPCGQLSPDSSPLAWDRFARSTRGWSGLSR